MDSGRRGEGGKMEEMEGGRVMYIHVERRERDGEGKNEQ